jgi:DNA-binding MarR family transcriptional regulator
LLRGLGHNAAATVSDLAEWLQIRHHTAVELVDWMSARGLVERHAYPSDGRRVLVRLSTTGRDALADLALLRQDQLRQLAPTLVDTLRDLLVEQGINQTSHSKLEGVSTQ